MNAPVRPDRHPQDWYVEQTWTVRALMQEIVFDRDPHHVVWDPCCGLGTIPCAFASAGFKAVGTDLVNRWLPTEPAHLFLGEHDFLGDQVHLLENWARLSIVANVPYKNGVAERFVRRALLTATGFVCILLPLSWRACEGRFGFFREYPPKLKLEFCDRPSMPPGTALADVHPDTGRLTAWKRGQTDYMWLVWDAAEPATETVTRIIPPRTPAQKVADRLFDLRRVGVLPHLEEAA